MRFVLTTGLAVGLFFAAASVATEYTICTPPLPSVCNSPTKRDALGHMFRRNLFPRTCPSGSGPASYCTPSQPTYQKTINLQCGTNFGDNNHDILGAILYEITDCPNVADGRCFHALATVPPSLGTIDETYLDIRLVQGSNPQQAGQFNFGQCPTNGECWIPLQAIVNKFPAEISSINDLCNHVLYVAFHVNLDWVDGSGDTCFPNDPSGNIAFGNAWFISQRVQFTCPAPVCCCCPISTPPSKFCPLGTGFGVPLGCTTGICGTNTLIGRGCGRWGWYHNIASLPYGPVNFHVGAGKNDLSKGEVAGTVEVKTCSSGSGICAFYVMNSGYRLNSAHVDVRCGLDSIKTKAASTNGYPCAPGSYNTNGGGECTSASGLGASWESLPFPLCSPALPISAIFHGTVSKSLTPTDPNYATCVEGCGNSDILA